MAENVVRRIGEIMKQAEEAAAAKAAEGGNQPLFKLTTTRIKDVLHETTEMPFERPLQTPASTDDSATSLVGKLVDSTNQAMAGSTVQSPSYPIREGDLVTLALNTGNGKARYLTQLYVIAETTVHGRRKLVASEYAGDGTDESTYEGDARTLAHVAGLDAGTTVCVQIHYHHRAMEVENDPFSFLRNELGAEEPQQGADALPTEAPVQPTTPAVDANNYEGRPGARIKRGTRWDLYQEIMDQQGPR